MPISDYLRDLRTKIGTDLVLVPAATGLVFDDAGRLLMAHAADVDLWVSPGGAIDPGESPVDAVVREVWEETNLLVEPIALCGVFGGPELQVRYANGDRVAYVLSVFECRLLGGELRPDGEEVLDARWVTPDELAALVVPAWMRAAMPLLIGNRGRAAVPAATWRPPVGRERAA